MGRIVFIVKKWWVLALVVTLALSLTSCSKKRGDLQGDFGFGYCDGTLGSFDVYVIPESPGTYELVIIPFQVTPGDIVTIAIVNSATIAFNVVVPETAINPETEISTRITEADLANFDVLAIRPATAGQSFIDGNPAADAVCALPLPGSFGFNQQN